MPFDSIESIQPLIANDSQEASTIRSNVTEINNRNTAIRKIIAIRASVESFLINERATGSWLPESLHYERLSTSEQAAGLTDVVARTMLPTEPYRAEREKSVRRMRFPAHDARRVPGKVWLAISMIVLVTAAAAFVYNAYPIAAAHGADPIV